MKPKRIATIALLHGTKILMGKRADSGAYTTPGGHVDEGESFEEGAKRELFEEAGIDLPLSAFKKVGKLFVRDSDKSKAPLHVQAFKVVVDEAPKTSTKNDPDEELGDSRWTWVETDGGLPDKVYENLHVKPEDNAILQALDLVKEDKMEKSNDPLKKDVVEFKKPAKKVDTRTADEKFNAAVEKQHGSRIDKMREAFQKKNEIPEDADFKTVFEHMADVQAADRANEDPYDVAVRNQQIDRREKGRQAAFDKNTALTPDVLEEVARQTHEHGHHELADAIRTGKLNPHQAADELEHHNFKGLAAALRMGGEDDVATILHGEKAHNDFDLNGRQPKYEGEREGALGAKYFASKNSQDIHDRLFKPDSKHQKNSHQTAVDALMFLHNNGLENTPTAKYLTNHITKNRPYYSGFIKNYADNMAQTAAEYAAGPKDQHGIRFESENPGFHQKVSEEYSNKVNALNSLHEKLDLGRPEMPKPRLVKSQKGASMSKCWSMRKSYEKMKKGIIIGNPTGPQEDAMTMSHDLCKSWKEEDVVKKYGKNSKQHLQYKAVIDESDIMDRHGEGSPEHKAHSQYMKRLGINTDKKEPSEKSSTTNSGLKLVKSQCCSKASAMRKCYATMKDKEPLQKDIDPKKFEMCVHAVKKKNSTNS